MPAGTIGASWAAGSWADTAWESGSWLDYENAPNTITLTGFSASSPVLSRVNCRNSSLSVVAARSPRITDVESN